MKQQWIFGVCLAAGLATAITHAQGQTAPTTPPSPPQTVQAGTKGSMIKIDGRLFVGFFDTEESGGNNNRALTIPDAKLRFTFTPSENISFVARFNANNAKNNGFDYFYLDLKNWSKAPGHLLRVGKAKIDVGEETYSDNPVESILITNSVAAVSGYDGLINFRGPLGKTLTYSVAALNATGTVDGSANDIALAGKIGTALPHNIYLSASYYASGDMGTEKSGLKVANLTGPPAGSTDWKRSLWEVDARWNYGPTGVKSIVGSPVDPRFQAAAAYGQFSDDATGAADRKGNYWYVEGLVNITDKWYAASRYSVASLHDSALDKLADSPVPVKAYHRLGLGIGYRLTPLTHIKAEYTINDTSGGTTEPDLNQIAIGIATKF